MSVENPHKIDTSKLDEIIQSYGCKKSNLIAILQKVQEVYRYLPEEAMIYIGTKIEGLSPATVFGVATFYAQFSLNPKGQYQIGICLGTACDVKGSNLILEKVKDILGIDVGECTPDGKFSLDATRCIGACGLAPVMTVNDDVYGKLTVEQIPDILKKYQDM